VPSDRRKGRITSLPGSPDSGQKPSLHWERRIRFSVPRTRFQTIRRVREAGASSAGCGLKSPGQRASRVEPQIGFAFGTTPRKAGPKAESKIAASLCAFLGRRSDDPGRDAIGHYRGVLLDSPRVRSGKEVLGEKRVFLLLGSLGQVATEPPMARATRLD
jgi:hypothetical protein